jgi:uncharacterized protein VirK/YbjX
MSIALKNNNSGRSSFRIPLPLLDAAWATLTNKLRRDGLAEFSRSMVQLCFAENPLAAFIRHREVVAFFEQPSMTPLRSMPFANKYLSGYLAKSLGKRARREATLHNFRCIVERAEPDFLRRVLTGSYVLWSQDDERGCYSIRLTFNRLTHYEGDLSVVFISGNKRIFELSFAIVPGSSVGSSTAELLCVGRVQGVKDQFEEIRRATKACKSVSPQRMLMLAVEAIAASLDIPAIAGVTDQEQLANLPNKYFVFDYNSFWETWVERAQGQRFYEVPVPLPQPAMEDVPPRHRHRARKRREFKRQVGLEIADSLRAVFPVKAEAIA